MQASLAQLPKTLDEMRTLPQASLTRPEDTIVLFLAAMCRYPESRDDALAMVDFLKGPEPLSEFQKQFIRDRFADGHSYVARSYFAGATPENDYAPNLPYTIDVQETPYSHDNEGYLRLWVRSGGADNPRQVDLRLKPSTGQWFLIGYEGLLAGIREPRSADPWA